VVFSAREQRVRSGKQLQRTLPACFLIGAIEAEPPFPNCWLKDSERDSAERDRGLERADGAAVLERARHALLRHRSRALDRGMVDRFMCFDPCADAERVDALLRFDADDGDVDRVDQLRCRAVDNVDDSKATVNAGIDAEDLDAQRSQLMRSRMVGPSL
jgi:hypothetical protein